MSELNHTLDHLGWFQMLLALGFVASYSMALTPFAGSAGQGRSALVALLCGAGFSAITDPWVHGVLLMLMAVAGMAVFIGVAWGLSQLLAPRGTARALEEPAMPAPLLVPVEASAPRAPAPLNPRPTGAHS